MTLSRIMNLSYTHKSFYVSVKGHQLQYIFKKDQYFNISLMKSSSQIGGLTSTVTWDKYGNKVNKQERKIPGVYIMANNGYLK